MQEPKIHHFDAPNPKRLFRRNQGTHRLQYYSWGDENSPQKALCIHGLTRNGRDFDCLANALAEDGYHVIAVDVAGRGNSQYLANPKDYGYPLYCADIVALLQHLNWRNITYIGTSMGGLMGMMLCAGESKIASSDKLISKLIINDIGYFIPKESLMRIGQYIAKKMEFETHEQAVEYFRSNMQTFGIKQEEHWQHLIKHSFSQQDSGQWRYRYDERLKNAFWTKNNKQKKMPDMNFKAMWKAINIPILVLRGAESDLLLSQTAQEMSNHQHVQEVVEFQDVGHAPMLMEDAQIDVVKRFLCGS